MHMGRFVWLLGLFFVGFVLVAAAWWVNPAQADLRSWISNAVEAVSPDIIELRHRIHASPELSNQMRGNRRMVQRHISGVLRNHS